MKYIVAIIVTLLIAACGNSLGDRYVGAWEGDMLLTDFSGKNYRDKFEVTQNGNNFLIHKPGSKDFIPAVLKNENLVVTTPGGPTLSYVIADDKIITSGFFGGESYHRLNPK